MQIGDSFFSLPSGEVPVSIKRNSRSRRIGLRVDPRRRGIIITLPPRATKQAGLALLQSNIAWLEARLGLVRSSPELADGAAIVVSDVSYIVRHFPTEKRGVWIEGGEIRVSGNIEFLPRRVFSFLRSEATRRFHAIAHEKALSVSLKPSQIVCKDTSSRWGSCTSAGVLMFSWRLVMAPLFVQDYVAAHEVAHLRHMNHSAQFWDLVRQLTPHTEAATKWLKRHGPGLMQAFGSATA